MAWNTPTITHKRGRLIRKTLINAIATYNGTTPVTVALTGIPLGVYAGTVQGRSDGTTVADVETLKIQCGLATAGAGGDDFNIFDTDLTITTDPDFIQPSPVFGGVAAATAFDGGEFCLPTNEWTLSAVTDDPANTTGTLEVWIGLLSHILEV